MTTVAARPILALDVRGMSEARAIVVELGASCDFYKVGSELFTAEGPAIVEWLLGEGKEVFLDLKFHDIPNTVLGAVRSASELGVSLVTVHAAGGEAMLRAAVEGASRKTRVLAVTVLTSLGPAGLSAIRGRSLSAVDDEVMRLASLAAEAGVYGVVCAGGEAARVRERLGNRLALLVPGIRLPTSDRGDQARVVTPAEAVRAGARYLVLGRAVTAAADRRGAWELVLREVAGA